MANTTDIRKEAVGHATAIMLGLVHKGIFTSQEPVDIAQNIVNMADKLTDFIEQG